jgi:hypothetical protein
VQNNIQRNRQRVMIKDKQGKDQTESTKVAQVFQEYYTELYTESNIDERVQDKYIQYTKKLNEADKQKLDSDVNIEDIKKAILE